MAVDSSLAGREALDEQDEHTPSVVSPVDVRSVSLTVLAIVAATFTLKEGQDFFIPLVLSVIVSYSLDPVVTWITAWRLPRALAALIVMGVVGGLLVAGAYGLRQQVADIVDQLPVAAQRLRQALVQGRQSSTGGPFGKMQRAASELERAANETSEPTPAPRGITRVQIEEPPFRVREYLRWGSTGALALGAQLISVVFLVYFMLVSGDLFKRKLVHITGPTLTKKKITVQILDDINLQVERFLGVQVLMSVLVGLGSYVAFWMLGLQQAAVWAVLAGLFNSIPYFGPVVITGGIFVVAFLQFEAFGMSFLIAASALAITSLEGLLLTPWLTSRAARMNAVAIFVGLLFWSWVWGLWGTLLAVPMLMALKAVADHVEDLHGLAELLGE
jgi:predicted PurR-regulated permease PerM